MWISFTSKYSSFPIYSPWGEGRDFIQLRFDKQLLLLRQNWHLGFSSAPIPSRRAHFSCIFSSHLWAPSTKITHLVFSIKRRENDLKGQPRLSPAPHSSRLYSNFLPSKAALNGRKLFWWWTQSGVCFPHSRKEQTRFLASAGLEVQGRRSGNEWMICSKYENIPNFESCWKSSYIPCGQTAMGGGVVR